MTVTLSPTLETVTITYVYDPLYRLMEANYSDGRYFHYTYDSVGNRLSEVKCAILPCTTPVTNTYEYDAANRLIEVNEQEYTWDDNGNLLDDGPNTYTYDAANRLTAFTDGTHTSTYTYSGLGDRLSQTVDSVTTDYALDLNAGLTQVLDDGTNTYLYGNGRIGELQPGGFAYHFGDALGSVRQLTDVAGEVTLAKSYEPFGVVLITDGTGTSTFDYASEQTDYYIKLIYLRSRWLSPDLGRFTSKDMFRDYSRPLTFNGWGYTENNPINFVDPLGLCTNCYVFFFPGLGNEGNTIKGGSPKDIEHGGSVLDNDLGAGEEELVRAIRDKTGAIVRTIYPYGLGLGGTKINDPILGIPELDYNRNYRDVLYPSGNDDSWVPGYKADEILSHLTGLNPYSCSFQSEITADDAKLNIIFVAYSGGGQMAYSTAQKLKGRLFVDNMVFLGVPFRAYGGMSNIGRLWNFKGEQDTFLGNIGQVLHLWEDYNEGYRQFPGGTLSLQFNEYNIYQQGATYCGLTGSENNRYSHEAYFGKKTAFNGVNCHGSNPNAVTQRIAQVPLAWISEQGQGFTSRFDANLNFLVELIEGRVK